MLDALAGLVPEADESLFRRELELRTEALFGTPRRVQFGQQGVSASGEGELRSAFLDAQLQGAGFESYAASGFSDLALDVRPLSCDEAVPLKTALSKPAVLGETHTEDMGGACLNSQDSTGVQVGVEAGRCSADADDLCLLGHNGSQ